MAERLRQPEASIEEKLWLAKKTASI